MFGDLMKVLGWTVGGAIAVKLLTSTSFGTNFQNIASGWGSIIGAINGSGGTPAQGTPQSQQGGSPQG